MKSGVGLQLAYKKSESLSALAFMNHLIILICFATPNVV